MAKTRTPAEEQATKEALFLVGARAFLRDGYGATSMKTLAEEAGCTTGKFYSNFSGKQEILSMLMETLLRKNSEEAVRYAKKSGDVIMGMTVFFDLIYRGSALYDNLREIYCEGLKPENSGAIAEQMLFKIREAVVENASLNDVDADMLYAYRCIIGALSNMLINLSILPEERREEVFLVNILCMLGLSKEEAGRYLQLVKKEDSRIRDKAYDVMVKLLEGRRRRTQSPV